MSQLSPLATLPSIPTANLAGGITPLAFAQVRSLLSQAAAQVAIENGLPPLDEGPGEPFDAVLNATALTFLEFQQQVLTAQNVLRVGTSSGVDVDSFWAPFGIGRILAGIAQGPMTFSTTSPVGTQLVVPVGGLAISPAGLLYQVIPDTGNASYNASLTSNGGGYAIAPGQSSVTATVACLTVGSVGNLTAGSPLSVYANAGALAITGIASVVASTGGISGGADREGDLAYTTRAQAQFAGGSVGTIPALLTAVLGAAPNITAQAGDGLKPDGTAAAGYVTIYANTIGSGSLPTGALLATMQLAVNARRIGGQFVTVLAPSAVAVNVTATLHSDGSAAQSVVLANATAALTAYLNGLGLNPLGGATTAPYALIAATLKVPGVLYPTALQVNGGFADVVAPYGTQIVAGRLNLTVV